MSLERFIKAQDQAHAGFDSALTEMQGEGKEGHWIWYIFPQLSGLGFSSMSRAYAIRDAAEAVEYLRNRTLRDRLLRITTVVAERTRSGIPLQLLMGSSIDATKLVSSLTLFGHIARTLHEQEGDDVYAALAAAAQEVLTAAASQGYPPCQYTLAQLSRSV